MTERPNKERCADHLRKDIAQTSPLVPDSFATDLIADSDGQHPLWTFRGDELTNPLRSVLQDQMGENRDGLSNPRS